MADARILYLATADGLAQLANPGKSDRWREIARALTGQDVRAVVASPSDALLVYAASTAGVSRSTNGGATWDVVQTEAVRTLAFDHDGVLYAGTERGVVLSSADGVAWNESDAFAAPVVQITEFDDDTMLSVAKDGMVCQREPEGWRPRELHVPQVRGLASKTGSSHTLFVVNKTSLVTPLGTHRLDDAPTGAIVVLSGQRPVLLVGTEGPLLRSEDDGGTLTPVEGPRHATVLGTVPHYIDQSFAGTADGGLWFSADRGRTWSELRSGYASIRSIAFARAL